MYNLHHIAISVLHQIGEEHRIVGHDQEASTSRGSSIRPPVSSTSVCMQPIQGRERGRVDWQGRGRDGEGGRGTLEPTLPPLSPTPIFAPDTSIRSHTYPSPDTFIHPQTYTSPSIAPHTYTLVDTSAPHVIPSLSPTSPPLQTTYLPSPVTSEPASMTIDITLSSMILPSLHCLPSMRPMRP